MGKTIFETQKDLKKLGYSDVQSTGQYDVDTYAAVLHIQSRLGVKQDGVL